MVIFIQLLASQNTPKKWGSRFWKAIYYISIDEFIPRHTLEFVFGIIYDKHLISLEAYIKLRITPEYEGKVKFSVEKHLGNLWASCINIIIIRRICDQIIIIEICDKITQRIRYER